MIAGVGTDLIELYRIEKACRKSSFTDKVYTEEEYRQAKGKIPFLAGNFAVKEAVAKCFGTGFWGFRPTDIEVLRDEKGKPYVKLYNNAASVYDKLGGSSIQVSISNTAEYALAFAVLEAWENAD